MSHATRPPRVLQLAPAEFRWLQRPDSEGEHGVLLIAGVPYLLQPVKTDARFRKDRKVIGFRLTKAGGHVYDLFPRPLPSGWQCDCGDFVFNRDRATSAELRCCKHVRCVVAALGDADLPVPQPVEPADPLPDAPGTHGDPFAYTDDQLDCR